MTKLTYGTALLGMLSVCSFAATAVVHAADGGETEIMADGREIDKVAAAATNCREVNDELNKALAEKRSDVPALTAKRDAACKLTYSNAKDAAKDQAEKQAQKQTEQAQSNLPATALGADARDSDRYERTGSSANQRGTKEKTYVSFQDAEAKHLPYGWTEGTRTSGFGARDSVKTENGNYSSSNHKGQDYSIGAGKTEGAYIYSSQNGKVTFAGTKNGYGNTVIVTDANGNSTQYSHLSDINVKTGDSVITGYHLGDAGSTGNSTGAHLHYGEMVNGNYVNPATSTGIKNYDIASVNAWNESSVASGGYKPVTGSGTTTGTANATTGGLTSGLGNTLLNNLTGTANQGGLQNLVGQLVGQLFNGNSGNSGSGNGTSQTASGAASSNGYSDVVLKTETKVENDTAANTRNVTKTVTYADGRTETTVVKAPLGSEELLAAQLKTVLGETEANSVMASIAALCASSLATSSDADMLKVNQCRSSSS